MRSTVEIICAVKERRPVEPEELRLALLVMVTVERMVRDSLEGLADAVEQSLPSAKIRAVFARSTLERMFYARKKDHAEWLGPANIPGNPEHDERFKAALRLLEKAEQETKGKED